MTNPLVWLVQALFPPHRDLREPSVDLDLPRFLAWRRGVLLLVLLITVLIAAIDTVTRLASEPRLSFTIQLNLEPEAGPAQQTVFGDLADLVWLMSFYAMPASALLALIYWTRPRTSRSM